MISSDRPTIKDVALSAGVSISTVSLVISKSPKVAAGTKKKVLEVINALHYIPNDNAVALRKTNKNTIAFIVPDMNDSFYSGIIRILRNQCNSHGIQLHIGETQYDFDIEKAELNFAQNLRPIGYIFAGTLFDDELIAGLKSDKIVFIDKIYGPNVYPQIMTNNRKCVYNATSHLISKGCGNIFYITQRPHTYTLQERLEGYKEAMGEKGIPSDDKIIVLYETVLSKLEAGYSIVDSILEKSAPDGIITSSDYYALGVMKALHDRGYSVPRDVSVIGFNDIEISKYYIPSLATIRQPIEKMSELAFSFINGTNHFMSPKTLLQSDFIIRDSVRR